MTLILGPTALAAPDGVDVHHIQSTQDMLEACKGHFNQSDVWIMAAAPADYRPARQHEHKMKKTGAGLEHLEVEKTPDILSTLQTMNHGAFIVGFATEPRRTQLRSRQTEP